jgi:exonuclease VII large subunit
MGLEDRTKRELKEMRRQLKEVRDRYTKQSHRRIKRWEGETQNHCEWRRRKHQHRVDHLAELRKHLNKKIRHKANELQEIREDKEDRGPVGDPDGDGWASFDGKMVAAWMVGAEAYNGKTVNWLQRIRDAGWGGYIVSGGRTPEYSESLCYNMCDAPQCPGTCAGRASEHAQNAPGRGAIDVSDYYTFERIAHMIGCPLWNDLPNDPVHFSVSGH